MNQRPDNPQSVSVDYLCGLDAMAPGTWLAGKKLDGWRRTADNTSGKWVYGAKHTTGPAAKQMPEELVREFESLPWPKGIALDMEWMGPRVVAAVEEHSLNVFDLLMLNGEWLGNVGFQDRYAILRGLMRIDCCGSGMNVKIIPVRRNPGLTDFFLEQKTDPLSEGIVVRHKDSTLVGSFSKCATGDRFFKVKYRNNKEML